MRNLKRWLLVAGAPLLAAGGGGEGGVDCGEGLLVLCVLIFIVLAVAQIWLPAPLPPKDDAKKDQK